MKWPVSGGALTSYMAAEGAPGGVGVSMVARIALGLANVYERSGNWPDAGDLFERAARLARQLGRSISRRGAGGELHGRVEEGRRPVRTGQP